MPKGNTGAMDELDALDSPFAKKEENSKADDGVFATGSETPPEEEGLVMDVQEPPAPKKTAKKKQDLGPKKRARKPLTPRQKVMRVIMRRAGVDDLPDLDHLLRSKGGVSMRICDIGLFIDEPSDEALQRIASKCKVPNRVNLSAQVQVNQVKKIGADILSAGRMYQPIQVARIKKDGALECTSGRHRLAFLALAFGPSVEIPVYIEDMTLQEARDAVVFANQARPTKALERAEHAVLKAVHGDVDAAQEELYQKMSSTKANIRKYCVYSVLERGYPVSLGFKVSLTSSRQGGALTTITNVESFWTTALSDWHKEMPRDDFDESLKDATEFLNSLAEAMQKEPGFDPKQHMASMTLSAIGKQYNNLQNVTGEAIKKSKSFAQIIIGMGDCGRHKSDVIYQELAKAMRKK